MYEYKAKVERIIDTDTLVARVQLGFFVEIRLKIRLKGIDGPDQDKNLGAAAKEFLEDWLLGKEVMLLSEGQGKYGRWLGTIYADQINVNALLVDKGYATYYK